MRVMKTGQNRHAPNKNEGTLRAAIGHPTSTLSSGTEPTFGGQEIAGIPHSGFRYPLSVTGVHIRSGCHGESRGCKDKQEEGNNKAVICDYIIPSYRHAFRRLVGNYLDK
ncbi:hypothetical protein J6590_046807 [Homalodisca vitripennis]|nr:hypothetical protein J6590_046807 [Homalodisca vitripennis]